MPTKKVDERYCIIILYLIRGFLHNGDESRSCQRLLPIASVSVSGTPPSNRKHTQEKRAGARYRADKPAIVSTCANSVEETHSVNGGQIQSRIRIFFTLDIVLDNDTEKN